MAVATTKVEAVAWAVAVAMTRAEAVAVATTKAEVAAWAVAVAMTKVVAGAWEAKVMTSLVGQFGIYSEVLCQQCRLVCKSLLQLTIIYLLVRPNCSYNDAEALQLVLVLARLPTCFAY